MFFAASIWLIHCDCHYHKFSRTICEPLFRTRCLCVQYFVTFKVPPILKFCLISRSFLHLGAGLSVGFSGLAAGFAIGIVGDAGVRGTAQQPRLFVGMILILIFAEVLGLYGLIVALVLSTKGG